MSEPRPSAVTAARATGGGSIVVVGEALVDLVITPDGSVTATLGGAPFNTARTCGRLGADVAFVGALSDDRFGSLIRRRLAADGVALDHVVDVELPTTLAAAELDEQGAATYRFYTEGTSVPAVARVPPSPAATMVFTGGLVLALEPVADAVAAMLATSGPSTAAGRPIVVVDVNCRPRAVGDRERYLRRLQSLLAHVDVVKVSDDDLAYLAPDQAPLVAARSLLGAGPALVLLTAGDGAVTALVEGGELSVPVEPVDVVDTIGAGDAFGGGWCAWWTATGRTRADLVDLAVVSRAVAAANAVAGAVCTRRGADPPWRHELAPDWSG